MAEAVQPLLGRIKARDKNLEDQIRRAVESIALNIGEGAYNDPGTRRARYFTAAGSAGETMAALRIAMAWGIVSRSDGERPVALLRRILAILWKFDLDVITLESEGASRPNPFRVGLKQLE